MHKYLSLTVGKKCVYQAIYLSVSRPCKDLVISTPNLLLDLTIQKDEDNYTSDHHTFIQLHHKIHHSYNLHPYLSPVHRELGNLHSRTQASRN